MKYKLMLLPGMATLLYYIYKAISVIKARPNFVSQFSKYKLPTPKIPHLTLTDDDIKDFDIFIIGDVHGCLEELEELLRLAKLEARNKTVLPIFVGDVANKGPHNAETIRKIRQLNSYAVRGNHDEAVLRQCLNRIDDSDFVLSEKYKWTAELDEDDIDFLRELPYTISIPSKNVLIVHAGIVPGVPLEQHDYTDFIIMRNLDQENGRFIASEHHSRGSAWAALWPGPEHVYFGHDARRKLQQYPYATGLDTGCLYGFFLTGCFIDSQKLIQVKAKSTYRPP